MAYGTRSLSRPLGSSYTAPSLPPLPRLTGPRYSPAATSPKRGIFPSPSLRDQSVLHGVEMDQVDVGRIFPFVPNRMFPKSPLPDAACPLPQRPDCPLRLACGPSGRSRLGLADAPRKNGTSCSNRGRRVACLRWRARA